MARLALLPTIFLETRYLSFGTLSSANPRYAQPITLRLANPGRRPISVSLALQPPIPGITHQPTDQDLTEVINVILRADPTTAPGDYKTDIFLHAENVLFLGANRVRVSLSFQGQPTSVPTTASTAIPTTSPTRAPTVAATATPMPTVRPTPTPTPDPCTGDQALPECERPDPTAAILVFAFVVLAAVGSVDNFLRRYE